METLHPLAILCPNCQARYRVVRIESPPTSKPDREVTCVRCGGPLHGREGVFIFKYFLMDDHGRGTRRERYS